MAKKSWDVVQAEFKQAWEIARQGNPIEIEADQSLDDKTAAKDAAPSADRVASLEKKLLDLYELYQTDEISYENFEMAKGRIFLELSLQAR